MRAEEHERHRRPSTGTSQHHMTKSRFPLCTVNGAVVRREGLILTWGGLVGRRSSVARQAAALLEETPAVEPGEKSAEIIVVEENEPESMKLSKMAGWSHFDEGLNVDREGQYSDPETPPRRRLQARPGQAVSGLERV